MTDRSAFTPTQWHLLVQVPRWVAAAASAAQPDNARHTAAEEEAGLLAIADGRESPSAIVADLARTLVDLYDEPIVDTDAPAIDRAHPEAGITDVLARAREAAALMISVAQPVEAAAYRRWVLSIADTVIGAVRSGAVLGLGGDVVSPAERKFRDQLALALQG